MTRGFGMTVLLAAVAVPVVGAQILAEADIDWCGRSALLEEPRAQVHQTWLALQRANERVTVFRMKHRADPSSLQDAYGIDPVPTDGWGRPIRLVDGVDGKFVVSFGADGLPGGSDDASDLIHGVGR